MWGAPIRSWGVWNGGHRVRNKIVQCQCRQRALRRAYPSRGVLKEEELNVESNWRSSIEAEEHWRRLGSANRSGVAPKGGYQAAHECWLVTAAASVVMFITGNGQNVPWYSSWENNTAVVFPLAYSDSAQWLAAAASAKVCGTRGLKYWDVVGWHPKLLVVKRNWWLIRSSTCIGVNHDFLLFMTFEKYASLKRSSLTWIWSWVSKSRPNQYQQISSWRAPPVDTPWMLLILSFKHSYFGV